MDFYTTDSWNALVWSKIEDVYRQAFSHGRKNEHVVKKLLDRRKAFLHVGTCHSEVIAMALTADLPDIQALLIDYIGVREDKRSQGIGTQFVDAIETWARQKGYDGIIIEVESKVEPEPDDHPNKRRVRFWEKCGFQLTDYIHDYKIVPELYKTMVLNFSLDRPLLTDGKILFRYISDYHRLAWGK